MNSFLLSVCEPQYWIFLLKYMYMFNIEFFFQSIFSPLSMVLCEWFCLFSYLLFIGFHITVLYIFITLNSNINIYVYFFYMVYNLLINMVMFIEWWFGYVLAKCLLVNTKFVKEFLTTCFWKKKLKSKSLYFQFHNAFFDFSGTNCKR